MSKKSRISIGPGAASIILILVVLSMSILGMLSLSSARTDVRFSDRAVAVAQDIYSQHADAERMYAQLAALVREAKREADGPAVPRLLSERLPEGVSLTADEISFDIAREERILQCRLRVLPGEEGRSLEWISCMMIQEAEETWDW